jgi:glycosyltransferase involved in cell wall biosynthesis
VSAAPPLLLDVTRLIWRQWSGGRATGIDRVCLAYLAHYGPRSLAVINVPGFRRILTARQSADVFALLLEQPAAFRRRLIALALRHVSALWPVRRTRGSLYLNIGHTGLDKPGFAAWVKRCGLRPVHFIHDLIPITHPQYCRAGESDKHAKRMRSALATASGIIGNSRDTLSALETFAVREGLAMPPHLAAWLGTEALPDAGQSQPPLDRPYFVVLGTIEARKNHVLLLDVWEKLGPDAPTLVIIGKRGWEVDAELARIERMTAAGAPIIEISGCDDDALARWIAHARALLFPSHVEGFGMPMMEAYAQGTPVIASDIGVFREIAGGLPDHAASDDVKRWADLVTNYAAPASPLRKAQIARMTGFAPPDWPSHFARVDHWLADLA